MMSKEEFVKIMAFLGMAYNKEFNVNDIEMYYEFLSNYEYGVLKRAIKNLIKKNKFLPKIAEIIEACESSQKDPKIETLEYMLEKGYFKEYSSNEETYYKGRPNEFERSLKFVKKGTIPKWLLEDMRRYYIMMKGETKEITNGTTKLIEATK